MDKKEQSSHGHPLEVDLNAVVDESKKHGKKKMKIFVASLAVVVTLAVVGTIVYRQVADEQARQAAYQEAISAMQDGEYEAAIALFQELGEYNGSAEMVQKCYNEQKYQEAISAMQNKEYEVAVTLFQELGEYNNSAEMIQKCYDAQSLEYLQTMYQAIDTIYQMDNKLADIVSTVINNVDKINSAGTKLRATTSLVMGSLYSGQGHQAYAQCSAYDLASVKAYFPSAQVSQGRVFYDVYVPIFSADTAQSFVDSIKSANILLKKVENAINTESLSTTYQEIQKQLLLAYDALKDYHSFVAKQPTSTTCEDFTTTATQKKTAVSDLLRNIPSSVKTSN